jgi:cytochrome P450
MNTTSMASRKIPMNRSLPLIGDSLNYILDAPRLMNKLYAEHGEVVRIKAFGQEVNFMLGADANKFVLLENHKNFASSAWETLIGPFFKRGLMLMDFDEHKLHRRIMQTAFTHDALVGYFEGIQDATQSGMAEWRSGHNVLIFDVLKKLTLDIGSEVFCGQKAGANADAMNVAFLDAVQAATSLIRYDLPGTRWRAGLRGRELLERHFYRELKVRQDWSGRDLFSRLRSARTESGELFSDDDVVNHMIFVLMAAHDTSTITLTNMIYQLAVNPEWQERLREESRQLGSERLSFDDLDRLTGMTLVMKETLRVCPPVPIIPRLAVNDCEFKGYQIKKGSMVAVSPWFTHYQSELWSNPTRFDPERFADGRNEDKKHAFQWLPFGGGAHKCIGLHFGQLEIKVILHQLLLKYRWEVPAGYVMEQDFTSLPIPKDRLPITLIQL